jgi:hypothetical protein
MSLAMAYSLKRRAKHKAHGGAMKCAHGMETSCPHCTYPVDSSSKANPEEMAKMSEGGMLTNDGYQSDATVHITHPDLGDHEQDEWESKEYNRKRGVKPNSAAGSEDDRDLNQHGEYEEGPQGDWMAEGGQVTGQPGQAWRSDNYSDDEDGDGTDMVGRIMAQRQRMYSKGGEASNQDEIVAGHDPNEFDDLHLRDDLEFQDTGADSGDDTGDSGEDERRRDIVSRIMRSRRLRAGRNPVPA